MARKLSMIVRKLKALVRNFLTNFYATRSPEDFSRKITNVDGQKKNRALSLRYLNFA